MRLDYDSALLKFTEGDPAGFINTLIINGFTSGPSQVEPRRRDSVH
jgi:hypothetical protein